MNPLNNLIRIIGIGFILGAVAIVFLMGTFIGGGGKEPYIPFHTLAFVAGILFLLGFIIAYMADSNYLINKETLIKYPWLNWLTKKTYIISIVIILLIWIGTLFL